MVREQRIALLALVTATWLAACQTEAPTPAPAAPTVTAEPSPGRIAPAPIDWASAPACPAKLRLLDQAARSDQLGPAERPPIAVILPDHLGAADWLEPPRVTIEADLPLAVYEQRETAQLDVPCLLLVDLPRDQRVEHRPVQRDRVRSFYQSGTHSERNPEYDLAQLRVRQAEREARDDGPNILKVGDPMLDLVGALIGGAVSGFSQGRGEGELEEANARADQNAALEGSAGLSGLRVRADDGTRGQGGHRPGRAARPCERTDSAHRSAAARAPRVRHHRRPRSA